MKKQKQIYVSPETETLVVRFEGGILTSSSTVSKIYGFDDDSEELETD